MRGNRFNISVGLTDSVDLFGIFWHSVVCLGMSPRIPRVWNVFEVAHPVGALAVEGFGTHFSVCCLLTSCLPGHVSEHLPCSMWALCSSLRISRVGFSQETGAFHWTHWSSLVCGHFLEGSHFKNDLSYIHIQEKNLWIHAGVHLKKKKKKII